jgi:hypothetical protein
MACTRLSPRLNAAWCAGLFSLEMIGCGSCGNPPLGFQASVGRPVARDVAAPTPRFSSPIVNNVKALTRRLTLRVRVAASFWMGNRVGRSDRAGQRDVYR